MDILQRKNDPSYLSARDLDGRADRTLTIRAIEDADVFLNGRPARRTVCRFQEDEKPLILNATDKKTLCKLYGTRDSEKLRGKRILLSTRPVNAFGETVDALRILPRVPSDGETPVFCDACGAPIPSAAGMTAKQTAAYAVKKYGFALCPACAKRKAAGEEKTV